MYKRGRKLCSTPVKELGSSSLSISDIKPSSSDSAPRVSVIRPKRLERAVGEERKRKRKRQKGKTFFKQKISRRRLIKSQTSDSEWEVENLVNDNCNSKDEAKPYLFESPERVRDVGIEKDYLLSPSLIGSRGINLPADEDEVFDKEEDVLPLDKDEIEIYHTSPIFDRSKVFNAYSSKLKEKWKNRLLRNKENGDWLIDLKVPTPTADLLWENYIQKNYADIPQFHMNDIERSDSRDESNDKNNGTDSEDIKILDSMLNEETKELLKSKKLCRIKGGCSRENGVIPAVIEQFSYESKNGESSKKLKTHEVKRRREKKISRKDNFNDVWCIDDTDSDVEQEKGTRISFNEFHSRSKREKNGNKVRIVSITEPDAVIYKRLDGNFGIIQD